MLQLKKIVKSYKTGEFTQTALNDISINFRSKEFVAILGPSGSGKTTCLNVIGGLDQYDHGDLVINGSSTKDFKSSEWDAYRNNSVGFIFQTYNLIPHLNIINNVEMGMTLSGVSNKEKHSRALQVLNKVGLEDHIHKNPNQLSGGQMQRVAIARAIVNDPDIILADEPTGALDTATSVQIMELIKEIAKDKLVIMVTHNATLANTYADRIIKFEDGKVVSDSNQVSEYTTNSGYQLKKTCMKFITALKLSGKNIATKKWRTILTAIGSSIGIIGIALVLSLSNGFNQQITNFESETLSGYPIMISNGALEVSTHRMNSQRHKLEESITAEYTYPDTSYVIPYDLSQDTIKHTNQITEEYIDYIQTINPDIITGISYTRPVCLNILKSDGIEATRIDPAIINFTSYPVSMKEGGLSYLENNYDLLSGSYPKTMTDLVLIIDKNNKIDNNIMKALGYQNEGEIDFSDIIGKEFKVVYNDEYYKQLDETFTVNGDPSNLMDLYQSEKSITIKIVGILRGSADKEFTMLEPGLAYSDTLANLFISNAKESFIVNEQQKVNYNILTGTPFVDGANNNSALTKEKLLGVLGGSDLPEKITLYPIDFDQKDDVTNFLSAWNADKPQEMAIIYTDKAAEVADMTSQILDGVTLVLISFAAISLFVSLIMISIITYISVLERTKEIGILRALGARKKDIARVFNAETFIIGACSGGLGILIAYLLTFPTNYIIKKAVNLDHVSQLSPLHAILLIVLSVSLTVLGGLIPARMAAKKNPVDALRS